MNLRYIERNGERVLQYNEFDGTYRFDQMREEMIKNRKWQDVPVHKEPITKMYEGKVGQILCGRHNWVDPIALTDSMFPELGCSKCHKKPEQQKPRTIADNIRDGAYSDWSRQEPEQQKPRDECIEWSGPLQYNGYGTLYFNNSHMGVHRLAWALSNGKIPKKGMDICHSCDNRKCINPEHLFEGTRKDNMQDALKKGRMVNPNKNKKTCKRGHDLSGDNLYIRKCGRRTCRDCMKFLQKRWKEKTKGFSND